MTTEEVLVQLRNPGNRIPREAIAEVIQRPEEFVPLLIAEIETATRLGDDYDLNDCLPSFAFYLLAQLRETRAMEPILAYLALDEKLEADFYGDLIAQDGAVILAGVGHGNSARLQEFALRNDISVWSMSAALDALAAQAIWRERPREEVVEFLKGIFEADTFGDDNLAWTLWAGAGLAIEPISFLEPIRCLYDRDLIDTMYFGSFEKLEKEISEDAEGQRWRRSGNPSPITDTAEAVSWWANFEEPRTFSGRPASRRSSADSPLDFEDDRPGVTVRNEQPKIGRNDLCPCGSGKKYKKCCMP